ncbi:MAG: hypothetical protein NUV97_01865 [archaeon]|nr:hypothetical protein [archaeon]MCR4323700.1 hypothetical protein [Nanoarchaeota archaeon]
MVDIDFLGQLIESMEDAVLKLEISTQKNKIDEANRLRTLIFDLHNQLDKTIGGQNV